MVKLGLLSGSYELFENFTDLFWGVGYFGWQIATLYALYVAFIHSKLYGVVFAIIFALTGWINRSLLKEIIYDPRPYDSKPFLDSEQFRKKTNGMPSGHAQQTAFALTFAYLLSGKHYYESIGLFLITVIQRFVYKNHTFMQLLVGSALGFIIAHALMYALKNYKK